MASFMNQLCLFKTTKRTNPFYTDPIWLLRTKSYKSCKSHKSHKSYVLFVLEVLFAGDLRPNQARLSSHLMSYRLPLHRWALDEQSFRRGSMGREKLHTTNSWKELPRQQMSGRYGSRLNTWICWEDFNMNILFQMISNLASG